jgi:hypothetical protein
MIKRFYALSLLLSMSMLVQADSRFGEGFGIGAFTGLVGGTILTKMASSCNNPPPPPPTYVVTPPPPAAVYVEDPYAEQKRMELAMREQEVRARELEQRRRERAEQVRKQQEYEEIKRQEYYAYQAAERARQQARQRKHTVVETKTVIHPRAEEIDLRKRELALKEEQTRLALAKEQRALIEAQNKQVKEQRALLEAQNRKKELELQERKLKIMAVQDNKTQNITVTKKVTQRELSDDDDILATVA